MRNLNVWRGVRNPSDRAIHQISLAIRINRHQVDLRTAIAFSKIYFQTKIIGLFASNVTESLFLSSRWSQHQECSRRGPFVFYFLWQNRFFCGPFDRLTILFTETFSPYNSAPSSEFYRQFYPWFSSTEYILRYAKKTLNYRVAYYAESLVSNTKIRSKMICMTMETLQQQTFSKRLYNLY